jgi:hypothetical protein
MSSLHFQGRLISVEHGGKWSVSRSDLLNAAHKNSVMCSLIGWVEIIFGPDTMGKRKISCIWRESKPGQLVSSHYTAWYIPTVCVNV